MTNATAQNSAADTNIEISNEQRNLAMQLDERVKTLELQGSLAIFAQARDLLEIRDQELYKAIEKPDGGFYQNFGDYVHQRTTKNPSTISQNLSVITAFSGYTDEQLAKAGAEKLDIARKMIAEGFYADTDAALEAAIKHSRLDLLDIRRSKGNTGTLTVALSQRKVVKASATRFEEIFQKYVGIYTQVHGGSEAPTDSQVMDFFLDVTGGLPNEFLMEAATGQGGAAPTMEGGFTPVDVPVAEVVMYLAEQLVEAGRDPNEVIEQLQIGIQSIKDRAEIEAQERKEQEKAAEKARKEQEKEQAKWIKRLQGAKKGQILLMSDGARAEVLDTSADNGDGIKGIFLKGLLDGQETVFSEAGDQYLIADLVTKGVQELQKAPPAPKEPKGKKAKADAEPTPESTIGVSRAHSARKPRKGKSAPVSEE
jgi:hypothetical protein